jgi:molybdenum cofactor cytidylyltransferase
MIVKAKGKRQKAKGRRDNVPIGRIGEFCLLPSAFSLDLDRLLSPPAKRILLPAFDTPYNVPVISAVILAAGASSRMGQPKLLLPLGREPLVRLVVRQVLDSGVEDVLVVVGCEHERISAALEGLGVRTALNPHYETGMGSSFRTAVAALAGSSAAMFALADQPLVAAEDYRRVLDAYREHPGGIVSVRYGDVTAPPHLFDAAFFPELAVLEHGARPVLQRHAAETTVLHLAPERLLDIDTPEDYERAKALFSDAR